MEKIVSTEFDSIFCHTLSPLKPVDVELLIAAQMKELKNTPRLRLFTAVRETAVRMSTLYLPDRWHQNEIVSDSIWILPVKV